MFNAPFSKHSFPLFLSKKTNYKSLINDEKMFTKNSGKVTGICVFNLEKTSFIDQIISILFPIYDLLDEI